MSDFTGILLLCLIPALVFLLCAYHVNRYAFNRANQAMAEMHRDEGWMGRYVRDHKPRVTVHSLVSRLFSKPQKFIRSTLFVLHDFFADVSFYQGIINWLVMRRKASKVVIRAGQNKWVDIKYQDNWTQAGQAGVSRSVYFFYDGRVSPSDQLQTLRNAFNGDIPLEIWIDWEHNYGGAFEGLRNVIAFIQAIWAEWGEGIEIGIYTGYYFWTENSNPIANFAQYKFIKDKGIPLWLAWYGGIPKIPAPWTKMKYHQWGTPAWGKEWGVETIEIDMNSDLSGDVGEIPQPQPENGETMYYKVTYPDGMNERTAPVIGNNLTGRVYQAGYILTVVELRGISSSEAWGRLENGNWVAIEYNNIIRADPYTPPPVPDAVRLVIESIETRFVVRDDATGRRFSGVVMADGLGVEMVEI